MKKTILLAMLLVLGVSGANAANLAPINVQQAHINTDADSNQQLTIGFDWFRDHSSIGGGPGDFRTGVMNLPRVDFRQSFDTAIPTRIGLNTALTHGTAETAIGGVETEASALGFNNLGLTLEAGLVQGDKVNITAYINQNFALVHSGLLSTNVLRPVQGVNAYGFQTGLEYSWKMADCLSWFGDVAYRFDVPSVGEVQNSLVYYNEAVLGVGDGAGLSIGLLGNSVYNNNIGTDLRLVPGIIIPMGDVQFRAGVPIGLTSVSPDFGVQASIFTTF
jgi:opacity protein-like surface antigen